MCGNVGAAGALGMRATEMFETMLELDIIRGKDSTGVMIKDDKGSQIFKHTGVPFENLYYDEDYIDRIMSKTKTVLIGHNRAATVGKVDVDSAHPFKFGPITGAHNGTLTQWHQLKNYRDHTVDSKAIYDHMAESGLQSTIDSMHGAYALVWYNEEEHTINFIRNSQRTLFFAFSLDETELYWASEVFMLSRAAKKARVTLGCIYPFQPMVHYKFTVPGHERLIANRKFGKFEMTRIKKYIAPYRPNNVWTNTRKDFGSNTGNTTNRHMSRMGSGLWSGRSLSSYKGNELVTFYLRGQRVEKNHPYMYGVLSSDPDIEVRVCPPPASKLWSSMIYGARYVGEVKKNKRGYLLININSIERYERKPKAEADGNVLMPEEKKVLYHVGAGRLVNEESFKSMLKAGCGICSSPVFIEEEKELQWVNDNTPICPTCCENYKNDPNYTGFIH